MLLPDLHSSFGCSTSDLLHLHLALAVLGGLQLCGVVGPAVHMFASVQLVLGSYTHEGLHVCDDALCDACSLLTHEHDYCNENYILMCIEIDALHLDP